MLIDFSTVIIFLTLGFLFVFVSLFIGSLIRPNRPGREKNSPYECGEVPIGKGWVNYNLRFYIVALIFVIFDVEIAFIYPVATRFRPWVEKGIGWMAFTELVLFAGILFLGLIYLWAKGDLEWAREFVQGGRKPILSFREPLIKPLEKK